MLCTNKVPVRDFQQGLLSSLPVSLPVSLLSSLFHLSSTLKIEGKPNAKDIRQRPVSDRARMRSREICESFEIPLAKRLKRFVNSG